MPPSTLFCPKCGNSMTITQPAPEKVTCSKCRAVIKIASPAKVGAVAQAAPKRPAAALAPTIAHVKAPTGTVAGLKIQDELASGGLGVVYLAYHLALKDFRAVKRPKSDAALDRGLLLARFRREVESLGGLYSNHIVRAYDAGADDEGPYLVMEYLDGAPLSRLAARQGRLPVPEACALVRQAALGLQAAHERGLVHRDVKPSNLMLARDGDGGARVVVIDWGLVKRAGEGGASSLPPAPALTGLGTAMGTADYMAPEQVGDARAVDARADVYSLGATLYCLLAGRAPFADKTDLEKLLAHQREPFPPLERLRPDVPRELLAVLGRMVEKDPVRRYATPGDAAAALRPFCCDDTRLRALLDPAHAAESAATQYQPAQAALPVAVPATEAAYAETRGVFQRPTVLAAAPAYSGSPSAGTDQRPPAAATAWTPTRSGPRRMGVLLAAAAAGLVLVVGAGAVGMWALGGGSSKDKDSGTTGKTDGKGTPTAGAAQVFIDEDFSKAVANRQTIPDGWSGDAFRVVKVHDEPCLEVSKPDGSFFVKLPPVTLAGDFSIEVACVVDANCPVGVRLDARKTNALQAVTLSHTGQVAIGDDVRLAPPNFKPYLPIQFLVKREGKKLRVFLNGEVVADKDLDAVTEFESMQLGMTANSGWNRPAGGSKVFRVKVAALP